MSEGGALHGAIVDKEEEEKFLVQGHVAFDKCNWGVETCIHMHIKTRCLLEETTNESC